MPRIPKASFDERRNHVIDAAMTCFSQKGFQKTTMLDVATEAGVSPGALYTYFNSKEDIIEEAAMERRQSRAVRLETASLLGGAVATIDQILTDFYKEIDRDDPASESRIRPQIWADALSNNRMKNILKGTWSDVALGLTEVVRQGQESGEIDPTLDSKSVALMLVCLGDGLVLHRLVEPETLDLTLIGNVLWSFLTGQFNTGETPVSPQPKEIK
jgi:AcrR family transcriptional regulator